MNKLSLTKLLFAMMLIMLLALVGCGTDDSDDTSGDSEETEQGNGEEEAEDDGFYSIEDFAPVKTNEGEAIEGGTLNFGLVTDTAFEGTLNYNFYSGAFDAEIIDWFDESLLAVDENYAYTQEGAATYEINEEEDSITFTIRDNVNWHDGEPVTAEDWLYTYEVIAHPDYDGVRYGSMFMIIEGMVEYHN
jgi:peptide/nickel transport system substrate-binding protein